MNIAFYVSGNAGRLRKVFEQKKDNLLGSTKLIFSDDKRNADMESIAQVHHIPFHCMHFEDIEKAPGRTKSSIMSDELLRLLQVQEVDYCFSFGDHLLVGDLLNSYQNRIINFHPSVLPMFPGMRSIDQAIDAGSNLLGNTAHFIDQGIDTGPIIMQNVVSSQLFGEGGYEKVLDQQLPMLEQIFRWLEDDRIIVAEGRVTIVDAKYDQPAFFPLIEDS